MATTISISQAKSLGAVGSILVLLTAVPSIGGLLGIVGFILILVAIKNISDFLADRSIFNNALMAVGLAIAGVVAGTLVLLGGLLSFMGLNSLNLQASVQASTRLRSRLGTGWASSALRWQVYLSCG